MEMVLVDWTRMGRSYCLAGAVVERKGFRIVRPLMGKFRGMPVRNVGWSPYCLEGQTRWAVFELIGPTSATPEPPHLEDQWVRTLKPCRRLAAPEVRCAILKATLVPPAEPMFGVPLSTNRTAAYLAAGAGQRSLATMLVPAEQISFGAYWRSGIEEPDVRVTLPIPDLGPRTLPVKDHHLLLKAGPVTPSLEKLIQGLNQTVRQMGNQVAVRLGLSRPFSPSPGNSGTDPPVCWLMADGFFSPTDPQP
jgi:hypothetical protein